MHAAAQNSKSSLPSVILPFTVGNSREPGLCPRFRRLLRRSPGSDLPALFLSFRQINLRTPKSGERPFEPGARLPKRSSSARPGRPRRAGENCNCSGQWLVASGQLNCNFNTFIRGGTRRDTENCNFNFFVHGGPRRDTENCNCSGQWLVASGQLNCNFNTFIRGGTRRDTENCNFNFFVHGGPRRDTENCNCSGQWLVASGQLNCNVNTFSHGGGWAGWCGSGECNLTL